MSFRVIVGQKKGVDCVFLVDNEGAAQKLLNEGFTEVQPDTLFCAEPHRKSKTENGWLIRDLRPAKLGETGVTAEQILLFP